MKIQNIFVSNLLGAAAVEVSTTEPVQLFVGRNGAGKSSIRDAIALALTSDLGRVSLKKEAGQLVHAGAEAGVCEIETSDGDAYHVSITAAGKIADSHKGRDTDPMLAFVLDAQRLARLTDNERRAFLFGLMGLKTDGPAIAERLVKRGVAKAKIDRIAPLLRSGFDAACKEAKAKATEAKGAWRALTGETYGSEKAKTWRAPVPVIDAAAAKELATRLQHCDSALESWQQSIGKLSAEEQRRQGLRAKLPALQEQALRADRVRTKLTANEADLAKWEKELAAVAASAGAAPRVGLVHELGWAVDNLIRFGDSLDPKDPIDARVLAALAAYEQEHGPVNPTGGNTEAQGRLPEVKRSRDLLASAVANDKRDLEAANRAQAEVDAIDAELAEAFDAAALDEARAQAETLKQERAELVKKQDALKALKAQADAAEKKTTEAAAHAADVAAWDALGDALAPDGIPGEILAEALGPINQRLAQSAADAEWLQVAIAPDMAITAGVRDYRLLSESEKWRADAQLAEAVAHLSNTRLLVLDRFDVLDPVGRSQLLGWLDVLAETNEIDTALVFGTLKALPAGLPSTIAAHWIENGVVGQLKEAA